MRDIYLLVLGVKPGKKIMRIDTLPQNWMGVVYEDYSVYAIPPFTDEKGNPMTLTIKEELIDELWAPDDNFNPGRRNG